jgi:hypothetical protein
MHSIVLFLLSLAVPWFGTWKQWQPLWDSAQIEFHLIAIQRFPKTDLAAWSTQRLWRITTASDFKLPSSRKRSIAETIGRVLTSRNQDDTAKSVLCWAIRKFGNDGKPALEGIRTFQLDLMRRPPPKGKDKVESAELAGYRRAKLEFLEVVIRRIQK